MKAVRLIYLQVFSRFIIGVLLGVAAGLAACSHAPGVSEPKRLPFAAGPLSIQRELRSWKTIRETNLVMQGWDFSCGSAALASLMRYYFNDNRTEIEVLNNILDSLSEEEIRVREQKGLTMLDLKNCAERMGYQAMGVQLPSVLLIELKGPVIIHLKRDKYKHFAVLRGIKDDRVYLADPIRGNITLRTWQFTEEWTGVALILGKTGFGMPDEHGLTVGSGIPVQDYGIPLWKWGHSPGR